MDTRTLEITRPCPVELDVDRSGRQFFCDHCQKDVHVLANWPRAEAEAFIAANRGKSMCVSLRRAHDGELLYADSPAPEPPASLVPVSRLRRRWLPEAAAAAGVAAALTACTPHQPLPDLQRPAVEEELPCAVPDRTVPDQDPPPGESVMEGGIKIPDPPRTEEYGLRGKIAIPEPRIERGEKPAIVDPPKPDKRKRPKWDIVDGGID